MLTSSQIITGKLNIVEPLTSLVHHTDGKDSNYDTLQN